MHKTLQRFQSSLYWKNIIGQGNDDNDFDPRYHIRSENKPDVHQVNIDLRQRVSEFNFEIKKLFLKRRGRSNLLPHQRRLLYYFQQSAEFIIGATDKNLGPFIIERIMYVAYAYGDHLPNTDVYKELTELQAKERAANTQHSIEHLLNN